MENNENRELKLTETKVKEDKSCKKLKLFKTKLY